MAQAILNVPVYPKGLLGVDYSLIFRDRHRVDDRLQKSKRISNGTSTAEGQAAGPLGVWY